MKVVRHGAAVGKHFSLELSLGRGQRLEVLMSVSELSWNKHVCWWNWFQYYW